MKAIVFNSVGNISLETIADPKIKEPKDVIVRITTSAICGTDLHIVRGTIPAMVGKGLIRRGTVIGHEGVGVVEQVGSDVKDIRIGDRVIIASTISCGNCFYCAQELYSQCDNANPNGACAGTAFFGGPKPTGAFDGLQAEKVRIPYADNTLIKIPNDLTDNQAILLSDILPTAYMGVEMIDPQLEDTVAVFGCGPVGQLVIACLKKTGIREIIAIDHIPSRLARAKEQGVHVLNFDQENIIEKLKEFNSGRGPNKIIDAVGIDAEQPVHSTTGFFKRIFEKLSFKKELWMIAPRTNPCGKNWRPGSGPSQVLQWAVESVAKGGTISIIGVYTRLLTTFPIGEAMGKNLTIRLGNCNHRKYIPMLIEWVRSGIFNPLPFITNQIDFSDAIEAYKHFDKRDSDWVKVILKVHDN